MITQQDFETLERLYTPLAKILNEHLRCDHGYAKKGKRFITLDAENRQQARRIRKLKNELDELTEEFNSLTVDYHRLYWKGTSNA